MVKRGNNKFLIFGTIIVLIVFAVGYVVGQVGTSPRVGHDASQIKYGDSVLSSYIATIMSSLQKQDIEGAKHEDLVKLANIVATETGKDSVRVRFLAENIPYGGWGMRQYISPPSKVYVCMSIESNFDQEKCGVQVRGNVARLEGIGATSFWGGNTGADSILLMPFIADSVISNKPGWYRTQSCFDLTQFYNNVVWVSTSPSSVSYDDNHYEVSVRCKPTSGQWLPVKKADIWWKAAEPS